MLDDVITLKEAYFSPHKVKTLEDFINVADQIRAVDLPLKHQKNELLAVLKGSQLDLDSLHELRKQLLKPMPDSKSLYFINQLRSEWWIIRMIRGTYADTRHLFKKTETSRSMLEEIDSQIDSLEAAQEASSRREESISRTSDLRAKLQNVKAETVLNSDEPDVAPESPSSTI